MNNHHNLDISLRPLLLKDSKSFHRWISDKEVVTYSLSAFLENRTLTWVKSYIREINSNPNSWNQAIILEGEEEPIGYCGLSSISQGNSNAEYYILIGDKKHWNLGFGTKAGRLVLKHGFEVLELNRIFLTFYVENKGASSSYRKLGFTEEGRLRQAAYRDGRFHDKVVMSILREEWVESERIDSQSEVFDEMEFVAVDVETANSNAGSICQVGLAHFAGNGLKNEWSTLVNPEEHFSRFNISIHGIHEKHVDGAPTFPEIIDTIQKFVGSRVLVCHTHFDRSAFRRACEQYDLPELNCVWLDSALVARRTWSEFSKRGYKLSNVCKKIDYSYQAHDALEDAKAAGQVILKACEKTGLSVVDWVENTRPGSRSKRKRRA